MKKVKENARIPWLLAAFLSGGHAIWALFSGRVIGLGPRGGHSIYVSYDDMPIHFLIAITVYFGAAMWFVYLTFKKGVVEGTGGFN